jgi:hypothetical protein
MGVIGEEIDAPGAAATFMDAKQHDRSHRWGRNPRN